MIDMDEARRIAADTLAGRRGDSVVDPAVLDGIQLDGGWRFWLSPPGSSIGTSHVLVAADGRCRPISVGTTDETAERMLRDR